MLPAQFQQQLLSWFDHHGRKDLPWQLDINPYRVWVSEIMLQQTQVASVIVYFNKFIERFPTVHRLAEAELDDVLQYWAGLGYYARARNLHQTARIVVASGGEFPQSVENLQALPGIGRSTAGAILSIALGQSQPILDGNVKRVLSRFHAIYGWPGETRIAARLWDIAAEYTPAERTGAYTQAMMDLGATLCTRHKPDCEICPVNDGCRARLLGLTGQLPEAKPRKAVPVKHLYMLILRDGGKRLLLEKRPPIGIWGGLWSLPEFDDPEVLDLWLARFGHGMGRPEYLPSRRHGFSHYQLEYTPVLVTLEGCASAINSADTQVWQAIDSLDTLGLPAPVKRLLAEQTAN